jgi:hypothetical protein
MAIPGALVYSKEAIGPPLVENSWTSRSDVTGTYADGQSLATTVRTPPAPQWYRGTFDFVSKQVDATTPVSLAELAGRYTSRICQGSARSPGPCTVVTDYAVEVSGRMAGRLTAECDFAGTLVVANAKARVLRASGSFSPVGPGATCPPANSVLLAEVETAPSTKTLAWWFTSQDGRVDTTSATRVSSPVP